MTEKHPIYPNAAAREADRLREEKLAADMRGELKELASFIANIAFELSGESFDRAVKIAKRYGIPLKGAK